MIRVTAAAIVILLAIALTISGLDIPLNRRTALTAGMISGAMGASTGIGAPVLAILFQHASGPMVRSTLALIYTVASLMILAVLALFGRFGPAEAGTGMLLMPGFLAGYWVANRLRHRLDGGATRPAVLLHCDFKLDNLILDPDTLDPRAIVDWDMGTRGDPLFDLATLISYWTEADDPRCMHQLAQMPTAAPGFPTRAELVERYARSTGVTLDDFDAFRVLGMFKLSVVFLQLHALFVAGRRSNPRYASFQQLADELLEFTLETTLSGVS